MGSASVITSPSSSSSSCASEGGSGAPFICSQVNYHLLKSKKKQNGFYGICRFLLSHWKIYIGILSLIVVYNIGFYQASSSRISKIGIAHSGSRDLTSFENGILPNDDLHTNLGIGFGNANALDGFAELTLTDDDPLIKQAKTLVEMNEYPKYSEEQPNDDIMMNYTKAPYKQVNHAPVLLCKDEYINAEYLFSDADEYLQSEFWSNPETTLTAKQYKLHHWATLVYEKFYRQYPVRKHIPHLKVAITPEEFQECFMNFGRPVIIPFEVMRPLGYKGKGYTLDEYMQVHPDKGEKVKYKANSLHKGPLLLGPALSALKEDAKKKKMGVYRNFPRNLKLTPQMVQQVGLNFPPYHNFRNGWQLSTMFMGSSTADTPNHSDCCDNFISHIVGTKRWILAPPTHTRYQEPKCFGGLCWGACKLPRNPREPAEPKCAGLDYITVDVSEGEMLFLPAAWFHAVYNMGATVMMNNWVSSPPSAVYTNQTGLTGGKGSRKDSKCTPDTC